MLIQSLVYSDKDSYHEILKFREDDDWFMEGKFGSKNNCQNLVDGRKLLEDLRNKNAIKIEDVYDWDK